MPEAGSICLEESLPVPVPWVYRAWTRPEMLKAWLRFHEGDEVLAAWTDVKPGGSYHLRLRQHNGSELDFRGLYSEVVPEQRLCLNWPAYGLAHLETRLELDFAPEGRGSLLVLLQDRLHDRKMLRESRQAWRHAIACLREELPGIMARH